MRRIFSDMQWSPIRFMKGRNKKRIFTAGLLCLLIGLQGCIQKDFDYQPSDTNQGILDVSAWGFVNEHSSFQTLKEAIERADLVDLFDQEGDRTFILPNDKAFRDFFPFNGYRNVQEIPEPVLKNLLRYFVVEDRVIFTDPELFESNNPLPYETANGQIMYLSHQTSFIGIVNEGTAKSFEIYTSNIQPTNGVIHVVGSVVYYSLPQENMQVDTSSTGTPLILEKNLPLKLSLGSSAPVDDSILEISGASPENIIYTLENGPEHGWLVINGTKFMKEGDRFTHRDIEEKNVVYIHDSSGDGDSLTFAATSKSGFALEAFDIIIEIE